MNIRLLAGLLALIHLQRPDQAPAFKSGVDIVRLDMSVTRNGIPVRGLSAADCVVSDNGVEQVVDSVDVERLRLSVELVLDTSGSLLGDRLTNLIAGADGLVAALRPGEWAGLLAFSHGSARSCQSRKTSRRFAALSRPSAATAGRRFAMPCNLRSRPNTTLAPDR